MAASPHPAAPRSNADYRWTGPKALGFLTALGQHGSVLHAARAVGMSRNSAYRLRARAPVFAEGWTLAQRAGNARHRQAAPAKVTPEAPR